MTNQAGKLPPAILAGFLLSIPAVTLHTGPSRAADECLGKPRGETPAGGHWYYYVEKGTGRHCWYLAADGAPRSSGSNLARRAAHHTGHKEAARKLAPTVANAHAELQAETLTEQDADARPATAAAVPAGPAREAAEESQSAPPPTAVLTTRWPQVSGVLPAGSSPVAAVEPASIASPATAAALPAGPSETIPAETVITPAPAASAGPAFGIPASQQILLAVIIGVLALWRLSGSALYRPVEQTPSRQPQRIALPRLQPPARAALAGPGDLPPWLMRNVAPASSSPLPVHEPVPAAPSRVTSPDRLKLDLDDNLQQLRTLITQLKQDARPQG